MDLQINNSVDIQMLAQLNNLNSVMTKMQNELASGKKVMTASDDPADVTTIVQNQADQVRVTQTQTNLQALNSDVTMANSVLETASNLMDQARSIGVEGASTTATADTRTTLAGQIQSIEQQIVGIANTTNSGRYIFGGDDDGTAPYSIDFTQTPPFTANSTAQATNEGIDAMGNSFPVSMTATDIFDSSTPTNNILQSLEDLRQGLLNNDATAITAANTELGSATNQLLNVQAFYGNVQSTITSATNTAQQQLLNLQTQNSQLTDADTAQVITAEQAASTQQQAVLEMRANLPRGSLFDMLG
jgi:flagellar hook-associated protein 3 FlgL